MVNLKAWEGLSEEHRAIIRAAVGAEAWQEFSDFNANNADALIQLIDTRGVQLRHYSDSLLLQVGRVAEDVVAESASPTSRPPP